MGMELSGKIIISIITFVLLSSSIQVLTYEYGEKEPTVTPITTTVDHSSSVSTRAPHTVLFFEDFENGWGPFNHWNNRGLLDIRTNFDGDTSAYYGKSVFMRGDDRNNYDTAVIQTTVDLSGTEEVMLEFYYAYEDMENYEHLWIDIDTDGNRGNGWTNAQFKTAQTLDNSDSSTTPGDFIHAVYDLSALPKTHPLFIQFRGYFYWSSGSRDRPHGDMLIIDNISFKANFRPNMMADSINATPAAIHTLTDETSAFNFSMTDRDNHSAADFNMSVDVRLSDNLTQIRYVDNISMNDPRLTINRTGHGLYNATLYFDPGPFYGFGLVDMGIIIFDADGLTGRISYEQTENRLELRNNLPVINVTTIGTDRNRVNTLNPSPISFSGTCYDLDNQSHSKLHLTISIRDEMNNTHVLVTDGSNGDEGVTIEKSSTSTYDFIYTWEPGNTYLPSFYDIYVEVEDGYGGRVNTSFSDHLDRFELYEANVDNVEISPAVYNRHEEAPMFINYTVIENTSGGFDIRHADVNISLRSGDGTLYDIYPGTVKRGGLDMINLTNDTFMVSYRFDGAADLPDGTFDLHVGLYDGEMEIFVSDFDENGNILKTFFNIGPEIFSVVGPTVSENIYYRPALTLSVTFSDPDIPPPGTFDFELRVRGASDDILTIHSPDGYQKANVEVIPLPGDGYIVNLTFDINDSFEAGLYDVEVRVIDGFSASSLSAFSENPDIFELYHNVPPSPPGILLPDETRDKSPLIHWYGATDTEKNDFELEYYIKIGTEADGDDILPWKWIGKNPFYQVEKVLSYATYYVEIMTNDGMDNSTPLKDSIDLFVLANLPPSPPNSIMPDFTLETLPRITWSGAEDGDGDAIRNNYVQIGTYSFGNDTLPWVDAGVNEFYQVQKELDFGSYYIQVKVSDGYSMSYINQELLHVVSEGNAPPSPPTEMYPVSTWDTMPNISWVGAYDINKDTLTYSIRIGSSSGLGDIVPWEEGITKEHYLVRKELAVGKYYVQIKAYDGELFSMVFEGLLEITEVGNLPPLEVTNITPAMTTNSTPIISWNPTVDPDGDDGKITYFIQIGEKKGHGDILLWYHTQSETKYALSKHLFPNRNYSIQVKAFDGEGYSPVAYQILEVIAYITDISFDLGMMNTTVFKDVEYSFGIRVMNRGTIEDNVTVSLDADAKLLPYLNLSKTTFPILPGGERTITVDLYIPKEADILGNYSIKAICTSKMPEFTSVSAQSLSIRVEKKKAIDERSGMEKLLEENRTPLLIGAIAIVVLILILIIFIIVKRAMNRMPSELADREVKDAQETTFVPQVQGGVVAKRIIPDAADLFKKKKKDLQLPGGADPTVKQLPGQKKRLALPQYSVVIDMNTRQVIGHTDAKEGEEEDEGDIIDFQCVEGKWEVQTTSVPSAHPYQKPTPTPSVPGGHLYKEAPAAPAQGKYQPSGTGKPPGGMPGPGPQPSSPSTPAPGPQPSSPGTPTPAPGPIPKAPGAPGPASAPRPEEPAPPPPPV